MAETGDYLLSCTGTNQKITAFRSGSGEVDLLGFRNDPPAMLNATTTTDADDLEWHRTLLRNPSPEDAELVTWVCREHLQGTVRLTHTGPCQHRT